MKKVIYILLIAFSSAIVFQSCTEDEVAPSTQNLGGENVGDMVKK